MKPVESRIAGLSSLALLVILTAGALVIPAAAAPSLELPVEGDVITPDRLCHENVHIEGKAVAVADVRPDAGMVEITVYISLADVQGVGETTGAIYLATGAIEMDFATPSLPATLQGIATFAWIPLGRCRLATTEGETLSMPMVLAFDADGNLIPARTLAAIAVPNFINYRNK
jgi:hypothetical protein